MDTLFKNILEEQNIRQTLSSLRQKQKDPSLSSIIKTFVQENSNLFIQFLKSDDAKTRKNAALLMGELSLSDFQIPLFESYQTEQTLFVKESYLTALSHYDCSDQLNFFKSKYHQLSQMPLTLETQKHVEAELRVLNTIILKTEGTPKHTFKGYHESFQCILLTNRLHKDVTAAQIQHGTTKEFSAGLLVKTDDIEELLYIRTYHELLFIIPDLTICSMDWKEAAHQLASSSLLSFLKKNHKEPAPFYFRLGIKSQMPLDRKSALTKALSSELERLTKHELRNTSSNYEVEIRLIENKSHTFNVMLKLCTLPDDRFSYRKESISASMKPVNAALLVALAKDYMVPDAQILDPFCGVATLLIERQMIVKGNTSYGIDIYPDAIKKAQINMTAAGQIIHFINKNCFDFTHSYLFDEIFTDMPFETGHKTSEEIEEIYENFFDMASTVLTENGTIIMYSRNPDLVRKLSQDNQYKIIQEWEILDNESTWLFIIK